MVTLTPPDAGELPGETIDKTGALYEKKSRTVPTRETIVRVAPSLAPCPGEPRHMTLVPVVHDVVLHIVVPNLAEGLRSEAAKLKPLIVTIPAALVGRLIRLAKVKIGLSNEKDCVFVPTIVARVNLSVFCSPLPSGVVQTRDVSVLHCAVWHKVTPSRAVPERSDSPKLKPKMEIDDAEI
jgi:hypothetical protein